MYPSSDGQTGCTQMHSERWPRAQQRRQHQHNTAWRELNRNANPSVQSLCSHSQFCADKIHTPIKLIILIFWQTIDIPPTTKQLDPTPQGREGQGLVQVSQGSMNKRQAEVGWWCLWYSYGEGYLKGYLTPWRDGARDAASVQRLVVAIGAMVYVYLLGNSDFFYGIWRQSFLACHFWPSPTTHLGLCTTWVRTHLSPDLKPHKNSDLTEIFKWVPIPCFPNLNFPICPDLWTQK